jgi:DUF4097 and DUF4098 domain-containing protein YvlB
MDMKTRCWSGAGFLAGLLFFVQTGPAACAEEQNLEKTFRVAPGGKLVIEADRGSIEVASSGADQVQVRVLRKVKGGSKANAEALLANHEVTFSQDGDTVSVIAKNRQEQHGSWRPNRPSLEVRYEASVPAKYNVALRTAGGDVRVDALEGDAAVRTSSGAIKLGRISGKVQARDSGGDISIQEAGNDVLATTSSGGITLLAVNGAVEARNSGGNIEIGEAAGSVSAETSSGSINIQKVRGRLEAKDSGGNISIGEVGGDAAARTSSGTIRIGLAKSRVEARNSGGGIEVGEARDAVLAETSSGSIRVSFSAPPKAESRLEVSGGAVTVGLPASAALDVDARSSGGRVVSEMPLTLAVRGEQKPGELRGKLNGGGPALILRASSGDIWLKKSVAAPAVEAEAR